MNDQRVICCSTVGGKFSALMVNIVPDLHVSGGASQCFPLYLYDGDAWNEAQGSLLQKEGLSRRDGITDEGLSHFHRHYPREAITKEDVFYYIYGLFHSEDYRTRFANNLAKEIPRAPAVKSAEDFWMFSRSGRKLSRLHVDYESVPMYSNVDMIIDGPSLITSADYRVEKMKYGKGKDVTTLVYNDRITLTRIPAEAQEYEIGGRPALDWVMQRQVVKTDKESGIVNDANNWAIHTMGNPCYPLELFLRVVTVCLETRKIVRSLPPLRIR